MLRILALEPYYGGSHRAFLDGYRAVSRHRIKLVTMPARKWKWRMRGAALSFREQLGDHLADFDVLLASDYLDLAAFVAVGPALPRRLRRVAYFHENQLTYPLADEDERDYQFAFTNVTTCLAAQRVLFNSRYHLDSFIDALGRLLRRMPDQVPDWVPERIRQRSEVVPVGVDLAAIDREREGAPERSGPLTVLWNHRWEYDKGARTFFEVLAELQREGEEFELIVTGQQFRDAPSAFEEARQDLGGRIRHFGYVESRAAYCRLLLQSDVAVSAAVQEFFGIAVVEATYAGCAPLLPDGLSYPELLPRKWHGLCLYEGRDDLKARLRRWMRRPHQARSVDLRAEVARFGWDQVAPRLDGVFEGLLQEGGDA
ncbi:MAG: tRNA-queuosine alpha-mannosyltransferase domain-containing protein [Planctomycetota bacterium]